MPILTNEARVALNMLCKGMPAEHIPPVNGETPDWQHDIINMMLVTQATKRIAVLRNALLQHEHAEAIEAEIWTDPKPHVDLDKISLSDIGNAEMFAQVYGDRVRYDHRRSRWFIWTGNHWQEQTNGEVNRIAIDIVRLRLQIASTIKDDNERKRHEKWISVSENLNHQIAMINLVKNIEPVTDAGTRWDADRWLLGVANGVVDLRTGQLRRGYPMDRITMSTKIPYDPNAKAPRWEQFLLEVFNYDLDLIAFIQRAVGYSLTGDISEQVLFLCWGGGANGKSTMLTILRKALGDYSANTPFSTFEMRKGDQATNDVAALNKSRFVTASETNESSRLNEARVKAITGGDPVTARFLYGEYFTYIPTYKIWLAMNHLPTITGTDDGIWRRVRLIPFNVSFKGREDTGLMSALENELPGILAWAVQGAIDWQRLGGLNAPDAVIKASKDYRDSSDILLQFIDECTIKHDRARIKGNELYKKYTEWLADSTGERPISRNAFGKRMIERGFKSVKQSGAMWLEGIGLAANEGLFES